MSWATRFAEKADVTGGLLVLLLTPAHRIRDVQHLAERGSKDVHQTAPLVQYSLADSIAWFVAEDKIPA
jgi:hypothetical protein